MLDLTPDDRLRIYEEEKARIDARESSRVRKRRTRNTAITLTIVGLLLLFGLISNSSNSNPYANYRAVVYRVTGYGNGVVSLTYTNESGGSEQRTIVLPWTLQFSAPVGRHLYVSAQQSGDGMVKAEITVGGQVIQSAESTARYGIATVGGIAE